MSKIKDFLSKKRQVRKNLNELKCPTCDSILYKADSSYIKGCLCFGFTGDNPKSKVKILKNENGINIEFNNSWDEQDIKMLTDIIIKNK